MRDWRFGNDSLSQMLPLVQERMETLGDFMDRCAFFFLSSVEANPEDLVPKKRQADEVAQMLQTTAWALEALIPWDKDQVETALRQVAQFWDWKIREITGPLFAALMGQRVGPPLFESIVLLGPDLTRSRIIAAIEVLGGVSKRKAAKLEKAWQRGSRD